MTDDPPKPVVAKPAAPPAAGSLEPAAWRPLLDRVLSDGLAGSSSCFQSAFVSFPNRLLSLCPTVSCRLASPLQASPSPAVVGTDPDVASAPAVSPLDPCPPLRHPVGVYVAAIARAGRDLSARLSKFGPSKRPGRRLASLSPLGDLSVRRAARPSPD